MLQFGIEGRATVASRLRLATRSVQSQTTVLGVDKGGACPSATGPSPVALAEAQALVPSRAWSTGRRGPTPTAASPISTDCTALVLQAIDELGGRGSGPSNRELTERVGVSYQDQISKLLARLEKLGLISTTGCGQAKGASNKCGGSPPRAGRSSTASAHTHDHKEVA